MNLYHCMIDLRDEAKALGFAAAVDNWMTRLTDRGMIRGWRLLRRKFGLASGPHADFVLEIEIEGLAQLDEAFALLQGCDDGCDRLYDQVHQMIAHAEIGLYRPYPDPAQRERVALI